MTSTATPTTGLARILATLGAVLSACLWGTMVWTNAVGPGGESVPPAVVAALLFPGVALAGAVAAWRDAPLVTLIAGLVGMFPVGLYFLPAPGLLKLIGIAPLLTLVAGVLLVRELRRSDP